MRQRNRNIPAKFEVLIVVHVKAQVFWEVTQMMVFWMLAMRWAGYVVTCWGGGEEKVHTRFYSRNLSERDHFLDLHIDRKTI
jgi:hypothetical protein